MAECNREDAERAYRRAEESFLAGNVAAALRLARKAQRLFPSLPGVANALVAYDVHAAGTDRYAVLGIDFSVCGAVTHDTIKKQFRKLSLLVHPDKNHSAAADGAFKLLYEACDVLSARHHPNAAPYEPPPAAAQHRWKYKYTARASATAKPRPAAQSWRKYNRAKASAEKAADVDDDRRAPPTAIYCRHCELEFTRRLEFIDELLGVKCILCQMRLRPPWQSKPPAPSKEPPRSPPPPQPLKPPMFPCPGQCPQCGTQYTSVVSVGKWHLRCRACSKCTIVNVQSRDLATPCQ